MAQLSRRQAFGMISATGATLAVGAATGARGSIVAPWSDPLAAGTVGARLDAATRARVEAIARASVASLAMPPAEPAQWAWVSHLRSWDSSVYLTIDGETHGFVALSPAGLIIAAACHAANRPMAVRTWGYDAAWGEGAGRFDGALCALDLGDLPADGAVSM